MAEERTGAFFADEDGEVVPLIIGMGDEATVAANRILKGAALEAALQLTLRSGAKIIDKNGFEVPLIIDLNSDNPHQDVPMHDDEGREIDIDGFPVQPLAALRRMIIKTNPNDHIKFQRTDEGEQF